MTEATMRASVLARPDEPPLVRIDFSAPVAWMEMPAEQARAVGLAIYRVGLLAEWEGDLAHALMVQLLEYHITGDAPAAFDLGAVLEIMKERREEREASQ